MESNENRRLRPIRVTFGTQLSLFGLGWILVAALSGIVCGIYTPSGLASIFSFIGCVMGLTGYLWLPIVFLGYWIGRGTVSKEVIALFLACECVAFALAFVIFMVWLGNSWLQ